MQKLLPIGTEGAGADVVDALKKALIRVRKYKNRFGTGTADVDLAAIDIVASLEKYYTEQITLEELINRINHICDYDEKC